LPEDEARRLPLDEIIMVVDAQMPVRAKRIQYFDDRLFSAIHAAQAGELPFPVMGGREGTGDCGPDAGASIRTKSQPDANIAVADREGGDGDATSTLSEKTAAVVQAEQAKEGIEQKNLATEVGNALTGLDDLEAQISANKHTDTQ